MSEIKKTNSRERFLRIYANLPLNVREEIICVLDQKGPVTWNVAYFEIKNNTKLGGKFWKN